MNCAHHADASAVAYCRTCGKALCANCTRPVRGVIYCEDCLGARMEGTRMESGAPAAGFVAGTSGTVPPAGVVPPIVPRPAAPQPSASGPNPTVAGILAGFFPFGVGAVYSGQYAKGLAHLAIFGLLIGGITSGSEHSGVLLAFSIIGLIFFWVYQIIDSVRSARAIQLGQPAPDPYGLGASLGGVTRVDASKVPMGAIVLIVLGVLFLLSTMDVNFGLDRFWPLILIGIGGWLFARNWGLTGSAVSDRCQCSRCRSSCLMAPAILITIGVLFMVQNFGGPRFWHNTWPVVLLVIGGVKLCQSNASPEGHVALPPAPSVPPGSVPPTPPVPPAPPSSPSEVNNG